MKENQQMQANKVQLNYVTEEELNLKLKNLQMEEVEEGKRTPLSDNPKSELLDKIQS